MKKIPKIFLVTSGALMLIAITWGALILYVFTGTNPHVPDPVYSPNGSKAIISTVNFDKEDDSTYLLVHLEVQDMRSGQILFQVQTRASHRMRWSVAWVDNDMILLDSTDIGRYCWKESDGIWGEAKCP